jgi:peptidoglycan/xylan/chitin deacetylase (PgdA/CDA1 family)
MWVVLLVGLGVIALAHIAPTPFLLEPFMGERAVWHMPRTDPPTVYLTFDDGPNPTTTPGLLDVLSREIVRATFFLIAEHVNGETAPIIRRMFAEGHAVALHSGNRWLMMKSAPQLAETVTAAADRIEAASGQRPCRAFRPHGGWRSVAMYRGLRQIDYDLIGWGWMLWDVDPLRRRVADRMVGRFVSRASTGDIIVMHDGDEKWPRKPQPQTVEATARLIPARRDRGFSFGTVCRQR